MNDLGDGDGPTCTSARPDRPAFAGGIMSIRALTNEAIEILRLLYLFRVAGRDNPGPTGEHQKQWQIQNPERGAEYDEEVVKRLGKRKYRVAGVPVHLLYAEMWSPTAEPAGVPERREDDLMVALNDLLVRRLIQSGPIGEIRYGTYTRRDGRRVDIQPRQGDRRGGWEIRVDSDLCARSGTNPFDGQAYTITDQGVAALDSDAAAGEAAPEGKWLVPPLSLADMANRLGNIGTKKARSILRKHGLKNAGNRQLWTVRLDLMPADMAQNLKGE